MSDYVVSANDAKIPRKIREFKDKIMKFSNDSKENIQLMKNAVEYYGISGSDELVQALKDSLKEKINDIYINVENLEKLVPELERVAADYQKALSKIFKLYYEIN